MSRFFAKGGSDSDMDSESDTSESDVQGSSFSSEEEDTGPLKKKTLSQATQHGRKGHYPRDDSNGSSDSDLSSDESFSGSSEEEEGEGEGYVKGGKGSRFFATQKSSSTKVDQPKSTSSGVASSTKQEIKASVAIKSSAAALSKYGIKTDGAATHERSFGGDSDEDEDEDDGRRVVKSSQDKLAEDLTVSLKSIKDAIRVHDWVRILNDSEKMSKSISKYTQGAFPKLYVKSLIMIENGIKAIEEAEASSKETEGRKKILNATQAKAMVTLKQKIKKINQPTLISAMANLREELEETKEEEQVGWDNVKGKRSSERLSTDEMSMDSGTESDDEESLMDDITSESESESDGTSDSDDEEANRAAVGGFSLSAPKKSNRWIKRPAKASFGVTGSTSGSSTSLTRSSLEGGAVGLSKFKDAGEKTRMLRSQKRQTLVTKKTSTLYDESEDEEEMGGVRRKPSTSPTLMTVMEVDMEVTPENVMHKLREVLASRGKKGTDRVNLVSTLRRLLGFAEKPAQQLRILFSLISSQFDLPLTDELWKVIENDIISVMDLLEAHPILTFYLDMDSEDVIMSATTTATATITNTSSSCLTVPSTIQGSKKGQTTSQSPQIHDLEASETVMSSDIASYINGSLYSSIRRLDDEWMRRMLLIDPQSAEYVEKLKDEIGLYKLLVRVQVYLFTSKRKRSLGGDSMTMSKTTTMLPENTLGSVNSNTAIHGKERSAIENECGVILRRLEHLYAKPEKLIHLLETSLPDKLRQEALLSLPSEHLSCHQKEILLHDDNDRTDETMGEGKVELSEKSSKGKDRPSTHTHIRVNPYFFFSSSEPLASYTKFKESIVEKAEKEAPNKPVDASEVIHRLCCHLYSAGTTRQRTRAMLCHIYHHAYLDRYSIARELLLLSHLQESISDCDIATQILYNRAMVQLGLGAFRLGYWKECQQVFQDLFSTGRQRELLAQLPVLLIGHKQQQFANASAASLSAEQQHIIVDHHVPFYMHINLELVEASYLTSSLVLEVPLAAFISFSTSASASASASNPPSSSSSASSLSSIASGINNKHLRRLLESHERNVYMGPPESTRDSIIAAVKSLAVGDWRLTLKWITRLKIWQTVWGTSVATRLSDLLSEKIREEALHTILLNGSCILKQQHHLSLANDNHTDNTAGGGGTFGHASGGNPQPSQTLLSAIDLKIFAEEYELPLHRVFRLVYRCIAADEFNMSHLNGSFYSPEMVHAGHPSNVPSLSPWIDETVAILYLDVSKSYTALPQQTSTSSPTAPQTIAQQPLQRRRLQVDALYLADKINILLEENEKLLEFGYGPSMFSSAPGGGGGRSTGGAHGSQGATPHSMAFSHNYPNKRRSSVNVGGSTTNYSNHGIDEMYSSPSPHHSHHHHHQQHHHHPQSYSSPRPYHSQQQQQHHHYGNRLYPSYSSPQQHYPSPHMSSGIGAYPSPYSQHHHQHHQQHHPHHHSNYAHHKHQQSRRPWAV